MSDPVIAGKAPSAVSVVAGKTYFWCQCGRSSKQPFCDGSHSGTDFTGLAWKATETKTVMFCTCKHTSNKPLCDGSHGKL